jgi:hypothetical protein
MPDSMTYKSLTVDVNTYPFLKNAKSKSYKLVLITYFKSWADLQNAKKMTINWDGWEF